MKGALLRPGTRPRSRRRFFKDLAALILITGMLGSCWSLGGAPDWEFYLHNNTDRTWYVRVEIGGERAGKFRVVFAEPGAVGPTVEWFGARDKPVELLDPECNVIGIFETEDESTFSVPNVDGLSAEIYPFGTHLNERNRPDIGGTNKCGGEFGI